MPRKTKKEETEESEVEESVFTSEDGDIDTSEEEEEEDDASSSGSSSIEEESEEESEEEVKPKIITKKGASKAITPTRRNVPKNRRLTFTYDITDKDYTDIIPTKKEIDAMKEAIELELQNFDNVKKSKLTNDSHSISLELTMNSEDKEEDRRLFWLIQSEINAFNLKPSKRVIKIFLETKSIKSYDKDGDLDILGLNAGNEEEYKLYITKDDNTPKEITDKDEKAILKAINEYFDELNADEPKFLPKYIEVDRVHKTVIIGVIEALGYLDDANIETDLINLFLIDNITVNKFRLGLTELDPSQQPSRKGEGETILTLVVLYIREWDSGNYYFVDEDLLKGKYPDVYRAIKDDDKDSMQHVMKILDKINVEKKLDDPEFKYRIGERLSADF